MRSAHIPYKLPLTVVGCEQLRRQNTATQYVPRRCVFVFRCMLFLLELKRIPRTHQTLVSQAKTYDSGTPTLKRKRVSTIHTRSAAYQVSPSHHETNTNAYRPVVASAVDAVDGGADTASAVPNFSAESLQRLSNAISGDWHAVESPVSAASGPASEVSVAALSVSGSINDTVVNISAYVTLSTQATVPLLDTSV